MPPGYKIRKIRNWYAAAPWRGAEDGANAGRNPMTTTLIAIAPRISYRALFIALFIAAYPLWHADFPTVAVDHVDVVPAAASVPGPAAEPASAPAVQSVPLPQTRLGQCHG